MRPYGDSLIWFIREAVTREQRGLRTLDSQSRLPIAVQSEVPALATNPIYLKQERLGEGGFGFVDRVWDVSTGIEYASKGFHKNLNSGWQQEVSMLRRVSHANIVNLVDVLEMPKPRLIFEYHRLGSLDQQCKWGQISRPEILQCLRQSLLALAAIHHEDMAHRDIKPENILLKCRDPWHVVLADFGLSKIGTKLLTVCGTCSYTAPELYGDSGYTNLCDIWPLGVVIFEFAFGLPSREDDEKGMVWTSC